jgi:hypothetical protein
MYGFVGSSDKLNWFMVVCVFHLEGLNTTFHFDQQPASSLHSWYFLDGQWELLVRYLSMKLFFQRVNWF